MGQLMFFWNEVRNLEGVVRAKLRDSTYDHMIFTEVRRDRIDELDKVCEKWGIGYEITYRGNNLFDVEIG